MALVEQNIQISFAKGINTKVDNKQVMQGELLSLSNGVFTKISAINEDPGYLAIPTLLYDSPIIPRNISNGNSLNTFNGQLILTDSQFLYGFSETTQEWAEYPTKVATSTSSTPIGATAIGNSSIGVAQSTNKLELYTYGLLQNVAVNFANQLAPAGIAVVLYDPKSDTILFSSSLSENFNVSPAFPYRFYAVGTGGGFWALYTVENGGGAALNKIPVSATAPSPILTSSLVTNYDAQAAKPAIVQSTTNVYILYALGGNITLSRYDININLINSVTVATYGGGIVPSGLGLTRDPNTGNIIALIGNEVTLTTSNLTIALYSSTLTTVTAPVTTGPFPQITALTAVVTSPTTMFLYAQQISTNNSSSAYWDTAVYSVVLPTLVSTPVETIYGVYLQSEAFIFNSQPTVNVGFFDMNTPPGITLLELTQSVYFTVQQSVNNSEFTGFNYNIPYTTIAKFSEGTAGAPLSNSAPSNIPAAPNAVLSISNSEFVVPYLINQNPEINSNIEINIYNVARLDEKFGTKTRSFALGNNLNINGGVQSIFDGAGIAETNYHIFPWQTTASFQSALVVGTPPPSLTSGASYAYTVTYEWTDNYGNLHRSSPGAAATGVAANSDSSHISQAVVLVNGTGLSESYKINNIQIVLWRTQGNGTVFFRITSKPNVQGVITFTDSKPDTAIEDSTQLYTTGGEVENTGPIAADIIFPFKNRLIAVSSENPYVWWYSKQVIQGFPVEFSDLFTQNIDMTGGPITAGYYMDDKMIFFKDHSMFYVIGDGPAPNGTNNDFSYPQIITTDVGCANQDSIIVIPIGLMFQSTDKGIYLLDRSLQVSYIGAPVEAFNNVPVTSAQLLPNTTQVRFTLNNGTILIYDYLVQQWSTHTGLTFVDSTIYKFLHTGLQQNGLVLEQTQLQWIDNSTPVALNLTTGWFSFAQLQGFQRVKEFLLLVTAPIATSLQIQIYHDFNTTTPIQTDLIPIEANTIRQQFRIFPAFQKCEAMQIVITEIPTGASGGGLTLSGMSFIMAIKRGLNKLPADRAYG